MNKMDWLVDQISNDSYEYKEVIGSSRYGTICMPTGTGKSGVMINDIVSKIKNNSNNIIINLSCPILKLTQQLSDDLLSVFKGVDIPSEDIHFYINSSDDSDNYNLDGLNIKAEKFIDFCNTKGRINIIVSCHKSLYKFISNIESIYHDYSIYNYFDEAHLLSIEEDVEERVDLDTLCQKSKSVYAFTATPDENITKKLLEYEPSSDNKKFIYYLNPREAIHDGKILPPYVCFIRANEDESSDWKDVTISNLSQIMNLAKGYNPNIIHKILVTVKSTEHLQALQKEIEDDGRYKVYSTCSKYGFNNSGNNETADIQSFIRDVTDEPSDCFVLHIQQLIAGIDIPCLTDCVIYSADAGSQGRYRKTIQIIGRTLRVLKADRQLPIASRIKKSGGVYFIAAGKNEENIKMVENNTRKLMHDYYGLGTTIFEKTSNKGPYNTSGHDPEGVHFIDPTTLEKIKDNALFYELIMGTFSDISTKLDIFLQDEDDHTEEIYSGIKNIIDNSEDRYAGKNTVDWLMNSDVSDFIYDEVPKMIKSKYGVFKYDIWKKLLGRS